MTKPTVSKHWRKPIGRQRSGLNPIRTTPPCYNNTTLGNRLYAQRKGPNVTNPICLTCKNCSHKFCCGLWTLYHTIQHRAVLIIFPLNLQTIAITRMLSIGGGGRVYCENVYTSMCTYIIIRFHSGASNSDIHSRLITHVSKTKWLGEK